MALAEGDLRVRFQNLIAAAVSAGRFCAIGPRASVRKPYWRV
jgi:hypothetical protein